jgi:hypothetical protein
MYRRNFPQVAPTVNFVPVDQNAVYKLHAQHKKLLYVAENMNAGS